MYFVVQRTDHTFSLSFNIYIGSDDFGNNNVVNETEEEEDIKFGMFKSSTC